MIFQHDVGVIVAVTLRELVAAGIEQPQHGTQKCPASGLRSHDPQKLASVDIDAVQVDVVLRVQPIADASCMVVDAVSRSQACGQRRRDRIAFSIRCERDQGHAQSVIAGVVSGIAAAGNGGIIGRVVVARHAEVVSAVGGEGVIPDAGK